MLAYRHAFHAGNHADVLKHLVLTQVLRHMALKDKPYTLIDTHAGAGGYSLASPEAQKKGEFEHGILRLWDRSDLPPVVADYVQRVRDFNPEGGLGRRLRPAIRGGALASTGGCGGLTCLRSQSAYPLR